MDEKKNPIDVVLRFIYLAFLAGTIIFFIYCMSAVKLPVQYRDVCGSISDGWKVTFPDGTVEDDITLPYGYDGKKDEVVTFEKVLPDSIPVDTSICISNSANVEVYVGDELRSSFYLDDIKLPGTVVKDFSMFIKINQDDAGKTLKVSRWKPTDFNGLFKEVYIGNVNGIITEKVSREFYPIILALILLFICSLIVVTNVVYYMISKKTLLVAKLSGAIALGAAWYITDSYAFQFVFGKYVVDGITSYLVCMLVPLSFISYVNAMLKKRYNKAFRFLAASALLSFTVFTILNFTGVFYFINALLLIDVLIAVIIVIIFAIIIYDIKRGYSKDYRLYLYGLIGFTVFAVIEILMINLVPHLIDGYYMLTGLYILFISGVLQQIRDIKSVDMERAKAVAANESKSAFLAKMSHEIRTPINSIIGMNEMILRDSDDKQILEYADYIDQSGQVLLSIVNDILDFSKIESGKMEVVEAPYKTLAFLKDMNALMKERASKNGLEAICIFSPDVASSYRGDITLIRQIVTNLISNAFKYTKEGRVILEVSNEATDIFDVDLLKISVSDTGIGIKDDDINKLFVSFNRVDEIKNKNIQGTGLGLAIVKNLVEEMHGEISVKSRYGSGSVFSVSIPQAVEDHSPIGAFRDAVVSNNTSKSGYRELFHAPDAKILVVDDNKTNLDIVKKLLSRTELQIDTALSANQCLMKCRDKQYDLIFMDHMMPEIDGVEAFRMLKNDSRGLNKDTKVIALTANAINGVREEYLEIGFVDYISKPIEPKLLEESIIKHLSKELVTIVSDD